jgi:hypothetical protein
MALVGDVLYVADTENHVVRAVNLRERTVTTAAGTGVQSTSRYRVEDGSIGNALQVSRDVLTTGGLRFVCNS